MAIIQVNECLNKETYDENFFIIYNRTLNYKMHFPHFHDGYEINFTLTDDTVYNVEGKSYIAKSGSVAVFNENEIHRTAAPEGLYERFILSFKPHFVRELSFSNPELTAPFDNRPENFENCVILNKTQKESLLELSYKMLDCYSNKSLYAKELRCKLILCEILLQLSEIYSTNSGNLPARNIAYREQIRSIMEYIKNNLTEDLCLDTLSAKFFISKSNLLQSFKKAIGMTPNQYIMYCRIMKSRSFLKAGIPVNKTCELVGYLDESSFIRTFKKIVGNTPKNYVKSMDGF